MKLSSVKKIQIWQLNQCEIFLNFANQIKISRLYNNFFDAIILS